VHIPFKSNLKTIEEFISEQQQLIGVARGDFSNLLRSLVLAAKLVNREVNRAGLIDILGKTGEANVQGEEVQKLDVFADRLFIKALSGSGVVCAIGSEEQDEIIEVDGTTGEYVVLIDPLDGSSNIDVNVSIGTIFSVYRRLTRPGESVEPKDYLQAGSYQVAAGYVVYGSSTMLVYSTGKGVHAFTLDPSIGEFFLSSESIRIPPAVYLSINDSQFDDFTPDLRAYLHNVRRRNTEQQHPLNARYIGSLVADFHRNLLKGGVFIYPGTLKKPEGKLRLCYEANPMAFLVEQAGGQATDGTQPILNITPGKLHQRTPLYIGSSDEMNRIRQWQQVSVA
jgi:fructose-1,6-bisphosphatase I